VEFILIFSEGGQMNNTDAVQKSWGWFLFLGIILIIAGTAAIMAPTYASMGLTLLLGWILVFAGGFQLVHSFGSAGWGAFFWRLLGGLIYLAAGIMLLVYPLRGAITLTLILAIVLVAQGIFRIIGAFQFRHVSAWGWILVGGLLSLVLGLMIYFQWPYSGLWILGLFLGIDLIFAGWSFVMCAIASRKIGALAIP
jgi:uncharacterized membrane protein HdeD (DUF308 family)